MKVQNVAVEWPIILLHTVALLEAYDPCTLIISKPLGTKNIAVTKPTILIPISAVWEGFDHLRKAQNAAVVNATT